MKKILVVGSLNMDIVIGVDNLPLAGETVLGKDIKYVPGGKGANQSYTLGKLGSNTAMLGCVGGDDFGNILLHNLEQAGVDVSHINKCPDSMTGTAMINVDKAGNNCIVVVPGANGQCDLEYLKQKDALFQECDYLLLQLEIPAEAAYYAIRRAKQLGKTVILNPAPAPEEIPEDILRQLDYITPNETELARLTKSPCEKTEDVLFAAYSLISKGVANVLVTLGEKGALLVNENGAESFPVIKVDKAVDTTAAGDCFNGAFAVSLAEGKRKKEAVLFAGVAASISVTRFGAQNSIPDREETERIFNLQKQNKI
jgi:ribokinase